MFYCPHPRVWAILMFGTAPEALYERSWTGTKVLAFRKKLGLRLVHHTMFLKAYTCGIYTLSSMPWEDYCNLSWWSSCKRFNSAVVNICICSFSYDKNTPHQIKISHTDYIHKNPVCPVNNLRPYEPRLVKCAFLVRCQNHWLLWNGEQRPGSNPTLRRTNPINFACSKAFFHLTRPIRQHFEWLSSAYQILSNILRYCFINACNNILFILYYLLNVTSCILYSFTHGKHTVPNSDFVYRLYTHAL